MSRETLIEAAIACDVGLWRSQAQMMSWWFRKGGGLRTLPPLVAKHLERPPTRSEWREITSEVRRNRRATADLSREDVRKDLKGVLEVRHLARLQQRREYMRNLMRKRRTGNDV